MLGMLCFWHVSRWILVVALGSHLLASPFLGLMVASAFEAAAWTATFTGLVWLATVSFWSPLAKRFEITQAGDR
jgi:hypothetical protein